MKLCSDEFDSVMLHSDANHLKTFNIDTKSTAAAPVLTELLSNCLNSNKAVIVGIVSMITKNHQKKMFVSESDVINSKLL